MAKGSNAFLTTGVISPIHWLLRVVSPLVVPTLFGRGLPPILIGELRCAFSLFVRFVRRCHSRWRGPCLLRTPEP